MARSSLNDEGSWMKSKVCSLIVGLLCAIGATAENFSFPDSVDERMWAAFAACIDLQVAIGNPALSVDEQGVTVEGADGYAAVTFRYVPSLPVYYMSVGLSKPYPDAFGFSCRLDVKTDAVLQVTYYEAPETPEYREEYLVDHDPLGGISEQEFDNLLHKAKSVRAPLTCFLDSTSKCGWLDDAASPAAKPRPSSPAKDTGNAARSNPSSGRCKSGG